MRLYLIPFKDFLSGKTKTAAGIEMLQMVMTEVYNKDQLAPLQDAPLTREKSEDLSTKRLEIITIKTEAKPWPLGTPFVLWGEHEEARSILFYGRLTEARLAPETNVSRSNSLLWQLRLMGEPWPEALDSKATQKLPQGRVLDLTSMTFEGSIKVQEPSMPRQLNLTLQAEWLQKLEDVLELGPVVEALFPSGRASSLNREFGAAALDGAKSGYTLLKAALEPEAPPETGILRLYPTTTPPLKLATGTAQDATQAPTEIALPRHWFRVTWCVAWLYEQKRIETLFVMIPLAPSGEKEEEIRLKIPNVEVLEGFSEGEATLKALWPKLLEEAEAELKWQLFAKFQAKVTFAVPFEEGLKRTLGQAVRICPRENEAGFEGTIQQLELVADGVQREARLTIACTPPWLRAWRGRPWRLKDLKELTPLEGLTAPLTAEEAVVEGGVENDAEAQFAALARQTWRSRKEIAAFLRDNPTRIDLRLRDLRTRKHLSHALMAEVEKG